MMIFFEIYDHFCELFYEKIMNIFWIQKFWVKFTSIISIREHFFKIMNFISPRTFYDFTYIFLTNSFFMFETFLKTRII